MMVRGDFGGQTGVAGGNRLWTGCQKVRKVFTGSRLSLGVHRWPPRPAGLVEAPDADCAGRVRSSNATNVAVSGQGYGHQRQIHLARQLLIKSGPQTESCSDTTQPRHLFLTPFRPDGARSWQRRPDRPHEVVHADHGNPTVVVRHERQRVDEEIASQERLSPHVVAILYKMGKARQYAGAIAFGGAVLSHSGKISPTVAA